MLTSKGCCSQGWNQENPNQGAEAAEDNVVEVWHPPYKDNLPTSMSIAMTLHAAQPACGWGRCLGAGFVGPDNQSRQRAGFFPQTGPTKIGAVLLRRESVGYF